MTIAFSIRAYSSGKWANDNCSDPKELFEAIVFKPEDVIRSIEFRYWRNSSHNIINSNFTDLYEDSNEGRCFTLAPSNEHIQYGIKRTYTLIFLNNHLSLSIQNYLHS